MPEGHTIHRLARDHTRLFVGQSISASSPQGRFAEDAARLSGKRLTAVEAHGKHLFYRFGQSTVLHIHLGLYGKFRLYDKPLAEPRGAVRLRFIGKERGFDLNGPNQCELLSLAEMHRLRARLGQDPLRSDSEPDILWTRLSRSRKPIAGILLDQSMIAGVGNIYRTEILFHLAINPMRPGCELTKEKFDELWSLTKSWMEIGVKYNRIITVPRKSVDKPFSRLNRHECVNIYKKATCPRCGAAIATSQVAGRKLFTCTQCQSE